MKEICDILRFWAARRGQPHALATLVAAKGSSYRRAGARMLIDRSGNSAGGVSAGCIEEEVIACAPEVLRGGTTQLLTYDTRLRFGCHGTIEILVEPVDDRVLAECSARLAQRQSCQLETIVDGSFRGTRVVADGEALQGFVQTIHPPLRLFVLGDSSDVIALRAQATLLGWEFLHVASASVVVLDDWTAVVLATHNYGRDCAALRALLPMGLKYLGLVGSRRRRDDLLFDALQEGLAANSQLFAPAGLHLGAETPEEIAVSIVSEIQRVFAAGTGHSLRDRKAPIHQAAEKVAACTASAA